MQARYYDPAIGRFLSNDPVGFTAGGIEYFNRYAYVHNDPVNLTDATGMCPNCLSGAIGGGIGGFIVFVGEVVNQTTDGKPGVSWGRVGVSTGKGAAAGAVIGATGCVACGAATAGALGAVDGGVTAAANGDSVVAGAIGQGTVDAVSTLAGGKAAQVVTKPLAASIAAEGAATVSSATTAQSVVNGVTESAEIVSNFVEGLENQTAQKQETIDSLVEELDRY